MDYMRAVVKGQIAKGWQIRLTEVPDGNDALMQICVEEGGSADLWTAKARPGTFTPTRYETQEVAKFLETHGIVRELTTANTAFQNAVSATVMSVIGDEGFQATDVRSAGLMVAPSDSTKNQAQACARGVANYMGIPIIRMC